MNRIRVNVLERHTIGIDSSSGNNSSSRGIELQQMHWDIAKLLELGISEEWLSESNITPKQARDLVKGLLYLREKYTKKEAGF